MGQTIDWFKRNKVTNPFSRPTRRERTDTRPRNDWFSVRRPPIQSRSLFGSNRYTYEPQRFDRTPSRDLRMPQMDMRSLLRPSTSTFDNMDWRTDLEPEFGGIPTPEGFLDAPPPVPDRAPPLDDLIWSDPLSYPDRVAPNLFGDPGPSFPIDEGDPWEPAPIQTALDALRPFEPDIQRSSERWGVPADVIRTVIEIESGFKPRATSRNPETGLPIAFGLMQLTEDTAKRFGVDDPYNPQQAIDGGTQYLRVLLDMFEEDTTLALAAYNSGEGTVQKYEGVPPYPETQKHLSRAGKVFGRGWTAEQAEAPAPESLSYEEEFGVPDVPDPARLRPAKFRNIERKLESRFSKWYEQAAASNGLNPDPDDPSQFYDYRAAFQDGVRGPGFDGHWPSKYKLEGHPNMVVGGFHVQTGARVPGTPRASEEELIELGWDAPSARRLSSLPEDGTSEPIGIEQVPVGQLSEKDTTFGQSIERGWELTKALYYAALEAGGEAIDHRGLTEWGRKGREEQQRLISQFPKRKEAWGEEGISSIPEFFAYVKDTIGEQIPMMSTPVLGSLAAGYLAARTTKKPRVVLAATLVGAYAPSFFLGTGETQMEIKERDPNVSAPWMAMGAGSAIALLDSMLPGKIGGRLLKTFGAEVAETIAERTLFSAVIVRAAKEGGKSAMLEGVTEALQGAISFVTAASATEQPVVASELIHAMREEGTAGLVMGPSVTVPTEVAGAVGDRYRSRRDEQRAQEREESQQYTPPVTPDPTQEQAATPIAGVRQSISEAVEVSTPYFQKRLNQILEQDVQAAEAVEESDEEYRGYRDEVIIPQHLYDRNVKLAQAKSRIDDQILNQKAQDRHGNAKSLAAMQKVSDQLGAMLNEAGFEVVDDRGRTFVDIDALYDENILAEEVRGDTTGDLRPDEVRVVKIIKPQVTYQGKLVQGAEVVVEVGVEQAAVDDEEGFSIREREQAAQDEGWSFVNQNLIAEAVDAQQNDAFSDEQKSEYQKIEDFAEKIEQLGFSDAEMLERKSLEKEIQESQEILAGWAREDAEAAEAGVSAAIEQNQERDDPPDARVEELRKQYQYEEAAHREAYKGAQASPLSDEEKSLYGDIAGWARDKTDLDPVDDADVIGVLDRNIQDAQNELSDKREAFEAWKKEKDLAEFDKGEGSTAEFYDQLDKDAKEREAQAQAGVGVQPRSPKRVDRGTPLEEQVSRIRDKIQQSEDRLNAAEQSGLDETYVQALRGNLEDAKRGLGQAESITRKWKLDEEKGLHVLADGSPLVSAKTWNDIEQILVKIDRQDKKVVQPAATPAPTTDEAAADQAIPDHEQHEILGTSIGGRQFVHEYTDIELLAIRKREYEKIAREKEKLASGDPKRIGPILSGGFSEAQTNLNNEEENVRQINKALHSRDASRASTTPPKHSREWYDQRVVQGYNEAVNATQLSDYERIEKFKTAVGGPQNTIKMGVANVMERGSSAAKIQRIPPEYVESDSGSYILIPVGSGDLFHAVPNPYGDITLNNAGGGAVAESFKLMNFQPGTRQQRRLVTPALFSQTSAQYENGTFTLEERGEIEFTGGTPETSDVEFSMQSVPTIAEETLGIKKPAQPAATPAPTVKTEGEASDTPTYFTLPAELKRSSPRYRDQELEFESDLDKALYIVREGRKQLSRADAKFMSVLRNHFPNLTDEQIREAGESVKERVRELSQADPDSGTVNIPSTMGLGPQEGAYTDKEVSDEDLFGELEGLLGELDDDIQAMPGEGQPGLAERLQLSVDKFRAKHGDSEAVGKLQNVVEKLVKAMEAGNQTKVRIYKNALSTIVAKGPKAFGGTDARKEKGETSVRPDIQSDTESLAGVPTESGTPTGGDKRPVRSGEQSGESPHGTPVVVDKAGEDSPGVVGGSKPSVDVPGREVGQPASDKYEITGEVGQAGNTQKIKDNVTALELLKAIENEGRSATAAEQTILAKYVGWGGLPKIFEKDHKSYQQLKDLLTPEEYEHARASVLNAHYTSKAIVDAVYTAIRQLGFTVGRILEPSVGIGNFFGFMPPRMAVESSLLGVELDSVTARMATLLYPKANIQEMGFQDAEIASNSIDVAVGNPPFLTKSKPVGGWKRTVPKHIRGLHNLFFLHALDKVRPGGIVAFVTSRYTLDSLNQTTRREIEKGANFLGAIRLPETAFKKSAGTEVVTDIIFLQKRSETTPKKSTVSWISTGTQRLQSSSAEALPATVNEYFIKHPEMVIGLPSMTGTMYAKDQYTVKDDGNLVEKQPSEFVKRLNTAIEEGLPSNVYTEESVTLLEAEQAVRGASGLIDSYTKDSAELRARVPEGSFWISPEGTLYVREDGRLVKAQRIQTKHRARLAVLLPLAAQVREVHRLERLVETTDEELKAARELLSEKYNAAINVEPVEDDGPKRLDHKGVEAAMGIDRYLQNDILGLDAYDPKTKKLTKADIFTKRTITPQAEATEADSAQTALELVLSEKGRIDIPWMARVTGLSEQDVINQLLESEIFEIPTNLDTDQPAFALREDYLSGDVKTKLAEARRASTTHERFQRNVRELEGVQPEDIQVGSIRRDVKMGAPWIPVKLLEEFAREFFNGPVRIEYAPSEGTFRVWPGEKAKNSRKLEGVHRRTAIKLFTEALNGVEPAEFDTRPHPTKDDSTIKVLNPERTHSAQAAQDELIREFKAWAFDGERGQELVQRYNEKLNRTRPREFDGSFLRLPGLNKLIKLRPHQKNVIWRALTSGSTLVAHVVGAGKTYAAIGTVMEWRRLGRAKKPLVVVPKALAEQWRRDFKAMYPHAKVLVSSTKNFSPQKRRRFFSQIKTGDWDAVIISHDNLLKMSVSKERAQRWYQDQIRAWRQDLDRLKEAAEQDAARPGRASAPQGPTIKRIENQITRLTESLKALDDEFKLIQQDGAVFDEMGIDGIVVDEAHEFKNYGFSTTKGSERPGIKGIPTDGVKKSADLMMKVDAIQEESNNKNVLFLTGTPVSNTLAELYVMQRFLQHQRLKDLNIESFDAWLNQFGDVVNKLEPTAAGVIRHVRRFRGFTNLKQLHKLFSEIADIKMQEDLNLPIPNIKRGEDGGVLNPIAVPVNAGYLAYIQELAERAVLIQERKLEPTEENMLSITTKGRSSSLDMRLVGRDQPPGGKVEVAADKIAEIYHAGTENKETQLVFSDLGVPKKERKVSDEKITAEEQADIDAGIALERKIAGDYADFSVYQELKKQLIQRGVKESEIAFTHDIKGGNIEKKRQELFDRTIAGEVRVLIGSTAKLGQGVNVQDRLKAVHMLDVPWKPAEIEQRLGRIFRQGNIFFNADPNYEVAAYSYINEGSVFDEYLWGIQLNKLEGVKRAMRGEVETAEDMSESLTLNVNQMMALAANDPDLFREMELEPIIRKLEAEREFHENRAAQLKRDVAYRPSVIEGDKETLATEEVARDELARDVNDKNTPFTATIEGSNTVFKNAKEFGQALLKHLTDNVRTPEQTVVARLNDKITVEATFIGKHFWEALGKERKAGNVDTWKVRSVAEVDGEQWRGTDTYFITRDPEGDHAGTRTIHAGTDPTALTRLLEFYKTDAEKRVEAAKAELKANEETLQEEQETLEKLGGFERETEVAELTQELEDIKKRRAAATMEERFAEAEGGDVVAHMLEWEDETEGAPEQTRTKKSTRSSLEKPKHPQEVLDALLEGLRGIWGTMPISVGGTSSRGAYHGKAHEIRIKVLGDVRALTHELGHAIDQEITHFSENLTSGKRTPEKQQTKEELIELGRAQTRKGYSTPQRVREGFAEYLSRWLVDPNGQVGAHANLRVAAPMFTRQFDRWIHGGSQPAQRLADAQALFIKYLESDPHQRLDAQVIDAPGWSQALYNRVGGWLFGDAKDPRNAFDRMQALLTDDLVRFDQMEKGLTGGTIGPELSVYWMFRSLPGVTGKAEEIVNSGPRDQALKKFGAKGLYQIVAPLLKGTTLKRQRNNPYWLFTRYLIVRRAQQYEKLGLRHGMEDQPDMIETGMTYIENPLVATAVKEYDVFVRAFRAYLVDMGALTQKQVDQMVKTWGDTYVPFHRVAGAFQETDHYRREAGVTDAGLILKHVKGAFSPLEDPIQALATDVFHFVKAAERNQAVYHLGLLSKEPAAAQWLSSVPVGKEPIRFNLQQIKEQILDALGKNPLTQEHDLEALLDEDFLQTVVTLWRPNFYTDGKGRYLTAVGPDGKRKVWKVHDEGLWEAINTMQPQHVSAFVRFLAPPTRLVRATATMNAPFMVRNQGRDTGAAWMYSTNRKKGLRHTIWDMTKGFLLQVDMNFLQTEEQREAWNEDFAQFKLSKAGQSTFIAQDTNQMRRTVGSLNRTSVGRFFHNIVFSPLDALRGLRELGEISNRLGPMIRKRNESVAENNGVLNRAIVQQMGRVGRESTQDFWKMGSFLRGGWNTLAAFTAAGIGGASRVQEQWQKGNRARGRLAWKATQYFTFGLALWYMNRDDDEYDARPPWEKRTYHHINVHRLIDTFVPTESQRQELKDRWGDNPFFMMARMHEWGEIGNLLEAYAEWKIESDPRWAERLPFEGDSSQMYRLILALAPDAIMGPAEILMNYETFTGRPIVNAYDLNQEAELQYNRWTSPTFRWLGKETGMSPAKLEYAWYMWTTGVGKLATRGIDQAFFQDVPSPAAQVPYGELGVRAFYGGEAVGTADLNRLYDQSEEIEGAMSSIRTFVARNEEGDREKAIALAQEHGLTWIEVVRRSRANAGIRVEFPLDTNKPISRRRNVVLARTREAVSNIRSTRPQMEKVFQSRTMTPEEKRMFLDDIVLDQVNYARSAFGLSPMKRNRYQSPLLQGQTPGR